MSQIKEQVKQYKVLFGLITKNVLQHIPSVLRNVEQYASYFKSYKSVIIDSSADGTYEYCTQWCSTEPQNRQCYKQPSHDLPRPLSLMEARNMYISILEKDFGKGTYLIIMDCDEVNTDKIDEDGFLNNFSYPVDSWDAMLANQINSYYDIYALRCRKLNCLNNYQHDSSINVRELQKPIPMESELIPVDSAFGGIGLYHTEKLKDCRYNSFQQIHYTIYETCEHVPFHEQFRKNQAKLFINPRFINHRFP